MPQVDDDSPTVIHKRTRVLASTKTHPHSRAAAAFVPLLLLRNNLKASQELQHHDPLYQPAHPDC